MHAHDKPTATGTSRRALVALALFLIAGFPAAAGAFDILLGTGGEGTFSHHTGRGLSRIVTRQVEGLACRVVPAASDVHNLTNLQGGSLDLALVDARALLDAVQKSGPFQFLDIRYDNLRLLVPVCVVPVTLVARKDAGIGAPDDLPGRRINIGTPRSPQRQAVETVLSVKNWTTDVFGLVQELPPSQSQDTMAFCHGTIQAMLHTGVHPDPALLQLLQLCNADLVGLMDGDMRKKVAADPALAAVDIPAGTYPSVPGPLATFGSRLVLATSQAMDDETARRVVAAMMKNQKRLRGIHPALSTFSVQSALRVDVGVERHSAVVGPADAQ